MFFKFNYLDIIRFITTLRKQICRPRGLEKYYKILKENSSVFFLSSRKKLKQPSQRNKTFVFFARKTFTLHQTRPLPSRPCVIVWEIFYHKTKLRFGAKRRKFFFCKDYPYGYPKHMRYCPELTKAHILGEFGEKFS